MFRSISIYLGFFSLIISFFLLLNFIYSQYFNFYLNQYSYLYGLIFSLISGIFFILIQRKEKNKINLYEKLLIIIFGFFYFPLIISIPYYFSIYNLSFIDCYFESISGFTSTGFSIFENIKYIDETLIIWRSTSQWLGGLFFLFSLILLIDIFNFKLKNFFTSLISINLSETKKQFLKILILYFLLTLLTFILLSMTNMRFFDSFNMSMTIISSGGFLSSNLLEEIISSDKQKIIVSFTMLFSFFNLYLIYNLITLKKDKSIYQEDILLTIYFLFTFFLLFIFSNYYDNFSLIIFSLISSISNIGISFNKIPNNLAIIFLSLTIIGGGFFSTSSGIKLIKFISLIKYSINELFLIVRPKYVLRTKFQILDLKIENDEIYKYFLSFLLFFICFFILSFILSLSGSDFKDSLTLAILTLTNTVNSASYNLQDFNFYTLTLVPKIFLILFMIIGRVEILVFLIFFKKFFLKN